MENNVVIDEEIYQQLKKKICKEDDYFNENEKDILMQFLMQRQRENIKNEVKL